MASILALPALGAVQGACLDRPIGLVEPRITTSIVEQIPNSRVDKIDLLLAIDNSASMADKQLILSQAVPDLVGRLIHPACIDADGNPLPQGAQPPIGTACPQGSEPEFKPITDINVGIISSSLGALGSTQCAAGHDNDKGHLLSRLPGDPPTNATNTFQDKGFLAWDPNSERGGIDSAAELTGTFTEMVKGVAQDGCGYEMQLESIYRFLIDPDPYDHLELVDKHNQEVGTDQTLLDQRHAFLRPDSLVAIIMLSDENDCSIQPDQGHLPLGKDPFYRSTSVCASDPNDPCCSSCGLPPNEGCEYDEVCDVKYYSPQEDPANHRCWNHKQRYGTSFFYPVQRYINAFKEKHIDPTRADLLVKDGGEVVDNPLFVGQIDGQRFERSPDLVFFAGIVGVPWQAIAKRDEGDNPDLKLGLKTVRELISEGAFAKLAGDPDGNIPPTDPFMQETVEKRSGSTDLTGALAASLPGDNPINGNDRTITIDTLGYGADLQYACRFVLPPGAAEGSTDCNDCVDASCDNPLCNLTEQTHAKGYPGLRQLKVLEGLDDQGIVASVCPAQVDDQGAPDYGYAPAVGAIIDRLKTQLDDFQCLPFSLATDDGKIPCLVLEASQDAECKCDQPGHNPADDHPQAIKQITEQAYYNQAQTCFCEVEQLAGAEGEACQNLPDEQLGDEINGYCYIDATTFPPVGEPDIIGDNCPANERRIIRFVNGAQPAFGATLHVTCNGDRG